MSLRVLSRKILSEYYSRKFSLHPLLQVIGTKGFGNREFGFIVWEGEEEKFVRNYSFKTPIDLKEFMIEHGVKAAYVGAMYDPPPTPKTSITKLTWLGRELVFDLDLTDYDDIRTCGKGKDHVCRNCWPLIVDAALVIDETLREDFGFSKITWVFSGRRGLHAWVSDAVTLRFDEEVRDAIASYISPDNPLEETIPLSYQRRIFKIIVKKDFSELMKQDKKIARELWREAIKKLPRIDKKVTMDTVRLLRMPGSIHDATGKLVMIVKDIQSFYPDDAPTVWEILGIERRIFKNCEMR